VKWRRPCYEAKSDRFPAGADNTVFNRANKPSGRTETPEVPFVLSRESIGLNFSRGNKIKGTQLLHNLSQSLWLDDITARVAIEQASTFGWQRYVGQRGCVVGMKTFGASAPLRELQRKFGFEPDQVVTVAKDLLGRNQRSRVSVAA